MPSRTRAEPAHDDELMTIEEFLDFCGSRPDEEKWELIEGVPVMSPSPTDVHQLIVGNVIYELNARTRQMGASWLVLPGTNTRVPASARSLPQPDVFVRETPPTGTHVSDEAIVVIEVLSKSNAPADRAWRRRVYPSIPNCQHYVTIASRAIEVASFDRSRRWRERVTRSLTGSLELSAIGVSIPIAAIYRATSLGGG